MKLLFISVLLFIAIPISCYKSIHYIMQFTYPSVSDNISIQECSIHEAFVITKTKKPYSYSLGRSGADCCCDFYWSRKTIYTNDSDYEIVKQKFQLCEFNKISMRDWFYFNTWMKKNKAKKFYGMYKTITFNGFEPLFEYEYKSYPVSAGRSVIWHTDTYRKKVKTVPYKETRLIVDVIPLCLIDTDNQHLYKDNGAGSVYCLDKKRYKGDETKYFVEDGWQLMKTVEPILYFSKVVMK